MDSDPVEVAPATPERRASSPLILGRWRVPFFYGWVIVAVCYAADFFASGFGRSTVSIFFTPMKAELEWSLSQLVGATTAATIGGMVVSPFLGRVIDRFGVKPVMLWGTLFAGTGMLLMMFVREVWQFWGLYASIAGLGLAEFSQLSTQSAVSQWFIQRRGRALMISTLGNTMGTIVGAPAVALIITLVGWRQAWGVMGVLLMVVLVPLVMVFIHNKPEDVGLKPDGDWKPSGKAAQRPPRVSDVSWSFGEAVRTRALWALMGVFVLGGSTLALQASLAPFLVLKHGMTAQEVGWVISGFWVPASISRVIWGLLVDRLPPRFCLFTVTIFRATGPFCLALLPFPFNIGLWMLFSGLLGNAYGILQPVMIGNYFGRASFATIQGGMRPLMAVPALILPLAVAQLYDVTGEFTLGFALCGVVGMMGAVSALFAAAPKKAAQAPASG